MSIRAATNTDKPFKENTSVRFSDWKVFIDTKIRLYLKSL